MDDFCSKSSVTNALAVADLPSWPKITLQGKKSLTGNCPLPPAHDLRADFCILFLTLLSKKPMLVENGHWLFSVFPTKRENHRLSGRFLRRRPDYEHGHVRSLQH